MMMHGLANPKKVKNFIWYRIMNRGTVSWVTDVTSLCYFRRTPRRSLKWAATISFQIPVSITRNPVPVSYGVIEILCS